METKLAELEQLLWQHRDGVIDAAGLARIDSLVTGDAEVRRFYIRYSTLCGGLRWLNLGANEERRTRNEELTEGNDECGMMNDELRESASGEPLIRRSAFSIPDLQSLPDFSVPHCSFLIPHSFSSYVGGALFSYLVAAMIVGMGLLAAWAWKLPGPSQIAVQSVPSPSHLTPNLPSKMLFVGRITGLVDCRWADPTTAVPGPVAVPLGRKYALASGLMEITYDTGARVILQGPCTYEVESPAGGFLSLGKLTAKVEKRLETANQKSEIRNQKLFAVRTPTAIVTDLGTEFGVEVSNEECTTSHVFQGVVEVQAIARDGKRGQAVRLVKTESARVGQDNRGDVVMVRDAKIAPSTFVRVGQLSKVAEESRFKAFRRWQTYSNALRNDPSLMAYYDFQRQKDSPSVLRNVAAGDNRSLDGVIQAVAWGSGHMAGKHALLFHSRADRVEVDLPQTIDDMTLAAWVCVESLASPSESEFGYSGLLTSNGWGDAPGQAHWQIRSDGRLGLVVAGGCTWYSSEPIFDQNRPGGWTHLAVVYDHNAAKIACYVNGKISDEATVETHIPIRFGPAWIGHWNGWEVGRNLHGRIDELAIFGRPLKSAEIQEMYEAGRPEDIGHAGDHTGKQ